MENRNNCIDCGEKVKSFYAVRCKLCHNQWATRTFVRRNDIERDKIISCACGCGQNKKLYRGASLKPHYYIQGHNLIGIKLTSEQIEKRTIKLRGNSNCGWNKGLTKNTNDSVRQASINISLANKGRKLSKEHIQKIITNNTGRIVPEETKNKLRERSLGKTWEELYGKEKAKMMRMNLSFSNKGHNVSPNARRLIGENTKLHRKNQIIPVKDTMIEVKIQTQLRELGYDFFTHQYRSEIEHSYQCDVFIPSLNLVIECDGNYWHKYPTRRDIDNIRTEELLAKGFKVLRLWEIEIKQMSADDLKNRLELI